MTVSVIIPTYNFGRFIREAIDSAVGQTIDDIQIVVVDDGSTDNTPEILAAIHDSRVEVVRTTNQGICAALNEGLARARGEYIAFLGADDRFRPAKLERQVRMMESEPDLVAVFTNFTRFDERGPFPHDQFHFFPELASTRVTVTRDGGGRRIDGDAFCTLVSFNEIPAWSGVMLFRTAAIKDLRFAVEGLHKGICGDLNFSLRAFRRGAVGFITEPLAEVRRHSENATGRASDMPYAKLAALQLVLREPLTEAERTALRRRVGRALIEVGQHHMADRRWRAASGAFVRALGFKGARLSALKNLVVLGVPKRHPQATQAT
ncbi:MAG: glycosyltransferase [Gemmatimonadota bacterium]|nr:glycosyltransferase [Gemmatimonadota bacterium]